MAVGFRFSGFHPSGGRSWLWPDDSAASHPAMRIVRACGHGIGWPYLLSASGGCAGFVSWLVLWHCFVNCLFVFFSGFAYSFHCMFFIVFPICLQDWSGSKNRKHNVMEAEPDSVQWLAGNQCSELFPFQPLGREPVLKKAQTVFPQIHTHIYVYTYKGCSR